MDILFPTLIACPYDFETTRPILQTEMSFDYFANYIKAKLNERTTANAEDHKLIGIAREDWNSFLFSFSDRFVLYAIST